MAQKHLRELLKEDQEPFLLSTYISHKRNQLKPTTTTTTTTSQFKPQKPITRTSLFPINLCKTATTKSPLYSPKPSNAIFLHIPAKTATLLLQAALRIHKHSATSKPKPISPNDGVLGALGSFFKRFKDRRKGETATATATENGYCSTQKVNAADDVAEGAGSCEVAFRCSCSGLWSESNEDFDTSSSGGNSYCCESPFRFVLQRSPSSSARRTPEFSSPPASPTRCRTQDKESNGVGGINKFQSEEVEEDKEQCSPVSVLDPPFDDDDDDGGHENDDEEKGFDLECSYANVQRTKLQLLDRLRRFERLAELDPIELEKRMLDGDDNKCETFSEEGDDYADHEREASWEEKALREEVFEILSQSSVDDRWEDREDIKRLVYDLIVEEERELTGCSEDRDMVIASVCRRLELWKEVESNTIDMMIEEDFSREEGMWKKNAEQRTELARELELALLCFLVEEVSEELLC